MTKYSRLARDEGPERIMARLDTGWHDNPKILRLGLPAMGLHAWSISYCDHARSDGYIPLGAWPALPGAGAAVKALLTGGLWLRADDGHGFWLHDYTDYNRTRAQIEADQSGSRERMRTVRANRRANKRRTNGATTAERSADVL